MCDPEFNRKGIGTYFVSASCVLYNLFEWMFEFNVFAVRTLIPTGSVRVVVYSLHRVQFLLQRLARAVLRNPRDVRNFVWEK